MTEYKPTGKMRFIDRPEPETGRTLKILQQEWEPVVHVSSMVRMLWTALKTEWRDVPSVDVNGNPK